MTENLNNTENLCFIEEQGEYVECTLKVKAMECSRNFSILEVLHPPLNNLLEVVTDMKGFSQEIFERRQVDGKAVYSRGRTPVEFQEKRHRLFDRCEDLINCVDKMFVFVSEGANCDTVSEKVNEIAKHLHSEGDKYFVGLFTLAEEMLKHKKGNSPWLMQGYTPSGEFDQARDDFDLLFYRLDSCVQLLFVEGVTVGVLFPP